MIILPVNVSSAIEEMIRERDCSHYYVISDPFLSWIISHLIDQNQYVLNLIQLLGVPQSSHSGPILFLVYYFS